MPFNFGDIKIAVDGDSAQARTEQDAPFHILLLGDFSGRGTRGHQKPLAARKPQLVDRDNFDEVMARVRPELQLDLGGEESCRLQFSSLDDFHPDRLLEHAPLFRKLRELRTRCEDPDTFAGMAEELGLGHQREAGPQGKNEAVPLAASVHLGSLLEDTIEQTDARAQHRAPAEDDLQKFVRGVTKPHLVATADPRQGEVLALVDRALGNQMRALLHVPQLQALEAAWRCVFLLVRRIETDELLKVYLLDLSEEELAADLSSSPDLCSTAIYRLLAENVTPSSEDEPWALVVGNYEFGPSRRHAELLGRLAKIACAARAPIVAAASPSLLGCKSFSTQPNASDWSVRPATEGASAWTALRGLPEANMVGLALPRFLLRLPYGKETDPVESFALEEMPEEPGHEDYLWGNPGFVCALLLAQSFSESGWELRPGQQADLDRLPVHVYRFNGDSQMKPCAEALMTTDTAERIMDGGFMPLASMKDQDAVRLVRFQSIAHPLRGLAGRWNR